MWWIALVFSLFVPCLGFLFPHLPTDIPIETWWQKSYGYRPGDSSGGGRGADRVLVSAALLILRGSPDP